MVSRYTVFSPQVHRESLFDVLALQAVVASFSLFGDQFQTEVAGHTGQTE